ncbi:MAG: AI-2E family transporter [Patescibacteria group bacterium]|nr:AI-2E family transporter [Patescibacteria group bacterium]
MKKTTTNNTQIVKVEISIQTILTLVAVALLLIFVYSIRNILAILFFAFILSSTIAPLVNKLISYKIPRPIAVTIIYTSLIFLFIGLISAISAPLIKESVRLINNLPNIMATIIDAINTGARKIGFGTEIIQEAVFKQSLSTWVSNMTQDLGNLVSAGTSGISGILKIIAGMFGGFVTILFVLTISIYITLDHDNFVNTLLKGLPNPAAAEKIRLLILSIEDGLGRWLTGQIVLSIFVGIVMWILLTTLRIPYALPLAILATMLNSIPHFGSLMAAIPAIVITFATGNIIQVILVVIGYLLVQQFENLVLGPKILANAVGLPPIIIILAVLIGAQLYGLTGILLAVPVAAVIQTGLDFLISSKH